MFKRENQFTVEGAHFAKFPKSLPQLFIEGFTERGDTVLDPFLGSGTTMEVAASFNRNCIGIEISKDYCENIVIPRLKPFVAQRTLIDFYNKFAYFVLKENKLELVLEFPKQKQFL